MRPVWPGGQLVWILALPGQQQVALFEFRAGCLSKVTKQQGDSKDE